MMPSHGVNVRVTLDEEAYAGSGIHIFAQMLDKLHATGKELLRCAARNGSLPPREREDSAMS
jgi:type VI secretion system protein ImpG